MKQGKIEADKLTVDQIYNQSKIIFDIPSYQRKYTWNKENLLAMFSDFSDFRNKNFLNWKDIEKNLINLDEYFFGNIIVEQKPGLGTQKWTIIDGQQRLTTLFFFQIALNYIYIMECLKESKSVFTKETEDFISRVMIKGSSKEKEFKFIFNNIQNINILKKIAKNPELYVQEPTLNEEGYNFKFAFHFFYKTLKADRKVFESNLDKKNGYKWYNTWIYLLNFVSLVVIQLIDYKQKHIVFENINSKGTPLEINDLLKNNILMNLHSFHDKSDKSDIENLEEKYLLFFDMIYEKFKTGILRKKRNSKQDIESYTKIQILNFYISFMIYKWNIRLENSTHIEIYKKFKEQIIKNKGIEDYEKLYNELFYFINIYYKLIIGNKMPDNPDEYSNEYLAKISSLFDFNNISLVPYFALSFKNKILIHEYNKNDASYSNFLTNNNVRKIIDVFTLWKFLFELKIGQTGINIPRELSNQFVDFYNNNNNNNNFNLMKFLFKYDKNKIKTDSKGFFIPNISKNNEQGLENLDNATYKTVSKNTIKLLYYLVDINFLKSNSFNTEDKWANLNIEHILPQKAIDSSGNLVNGWDLHIKLNDYWKYLHSIGNLTILDTKKNTSLGNDSFENKQKKYFKNKEIKLSIHSELTEEKCNKWNTQKIKSQTKLYKKWFSDLIISMQNNSMQNNEK